MVSSIEVLQEQVTQLPLKRGVVVKINGVSYSEDTGGVPSDVAIIFIAQNFTRYQLFEEIEDISVRVRKAKEQHDFEPLDTDDSNDTDVFVYGFYKRLPIKVAIAIIQSFIGLQIKQPYSKTKVQNVLTNLDTEKKGRMKDYTSEWFASGTVKGRSISIDGVISDSEVLKASAVEAKKE